MAAQITLNPVDRVEVLTVIDNTVDLLLPSTNEVRRIGLNAIDGQSLPVVEAPLLESGEAVDAPVAEHGLSLLLCIWSGDRSRLVLFDTGSSIGALVHNLKALRVDSAQIEAIVLSHGHFDHTTGLNGLARELRPLPPLFAHPDCWLPRRVAVPGRDPYKLPATTSEKLRAAGFHVIERRAPTSLLDDTVLLTGEIERTTEFENGMLFHQAWRDGEWRPDPLIADDQAALLHIRGKGLVVITGCGHAGVVNIVRYARKLTGVDRVYAVLGGFHLSTPLFEARIAPTLTALREFAPQMVVPAHCTGWRATHALAATFPDAFVPSSVGTRYAFHSGN